MKDEYKQPEDEKELEIEKVLFTFDDFLAIFLKGTLVNVIKDISETVKFFKHTR